MRNALHFRLSLLLAGTLSFADPSVAQRTIGFNPQKKDSFEAALTRYQNCIKRLPFQYHTVGRETLALTATPEALQILAQDYDKCRNYPDYTRYTIASLIGVYFNAEKFVPALAAMRNEHGKSVDVWLWVETLRIEANHGGHETVQAIATGDKDVLHRAAAIAALGNSSRGSIKAAIVQNCVEFPKKEGERNLLLGAMSGALFENKSRVNDDDYREALRAYISLLSDDVKLTHTAKVQMGRHLQWILKGPAMFVNPEPWLELLERGDVKIKEDNRTRAQSRFFGIETEGERFCYVLDMSDSMCKEIAPSARPQGPITGPRQKKPAGTLPDESDLPWNNIRTRWDLAREQLRISLLRLSSDKYFSIVWFGDEAGTLDATKGMVKATKGNISRAMAELDKIEVGKAGQDQALDGKLRGKTNMHAGLRVAYSLARSGFVEKDAYVDDDVLNDGCDTIFLLSDGAPSWDEFEMKDKDYGEGKQVVDTEYGVQVARQPSTTYHGPFVWDAWLLEDVRRMNAFRRIRMHCIGLGEANMQLLERLASIGHGDVFSFGAKK